MKRPTLLAGWLLLAVALVPARAEKIIRDITFATVGDTTLQLDLYLPDTAPAGLIVWVHGGAWRGGSRSSVDLKGLTARGWAIASVDYRLSTVARFPAQAHDIKAAIRFLRAHAAEYGYPADRFVIAGSSAGGHLAALVGVTNGDKELEGGVGANPGESSDVQAQVILFGASNLTTILKQSTPFGLNMRVPALDLFLGGQPEAVPELAKLASPVFHVDASDPPLLLEHGDQDPQMPINQSHELKGAYEKLGLPVTFKAMHGSAHGGPAFTTDANLAFIDRFLREQLPATATMPGAASIPLFNGQSLEGWSVFTQEKADTELFQVTDGMLHVYRDAPAGSPQPFGYLVTTAEYSDYRLTLEYKWGDKKFAPRADPDTVRDAGVCYHMRGPDEIWPVSAECQIQEGDTGDVWLIHTRGTSHVHPDNMNYWTLDRTSGVELTKGDDPKGYQRFLRSYSYEQAGWNRLELIVRGDSATYLINGHVANRVTGLKHWDARTGAWQPLTKGKILLQAEGAEIFYRNVRLQPLPPLPATGS